MEEKYGKNFRVNCQDLITMTVPEKIEYIAKRKKFLEKKQKDSGISKEVQQRLQQRNMVVADLKFLPASTLIDILQTDTQKTENDKSADKQQSKN